MMRVSFVQFAAAAATFATLGVAPASAQPPTAAPAREPAAKTKTLPLSDARWAPWVGCWRSVDDPAGAGARLCVTPTAEGVATTTVVGGQSIASELRIADGRPHPIAEGDCRGTETARWSTRALRLYRTATVTCEGDAPRTRSTVSFFVNGPTWVDVETVSRDGDETAVRVTRFERAYDQKLPDGSVVGPPTVTAPLSLARIAPFTVDDVIELSAALPPDGVQAAISEAPTPFRLNAKALTALADAGVGERVIDLMIGVTYPEKFVVDRLYASGGPVGPWAGFGPGLDPFLFGPMMFDPLSMMNCFSPLGWASSLYWTSCGRGFGFQNVNGPFGFFDPWNAGWVNIAGGGGVGGGGSVSAPPVGEGRVVNGRGYTQVRPVEPLPIIGGGNSGWAGASSSSGGGSSGSSGVSSSGYSGGGGGGGGGDRMAVPRGPGF